MKAGEENIPTIFSKKAIPTVLAICDYIADGRETTPQLMILTVGALSNLLKKGKGRPKKKGNIYGRKGRNHGKQTHRRDKSLSRKEKTRASEWKRNKRSSTGNRIYQ